MAKSNNHKEATAVDPRQRMKEVRADMKMYMEQKSNPDGLNHLGEYPENWDDAVRTIIALQDMLEDSMDRHAKATKRIAAMVDQIDILEGQLAFNDFTDTIEMIGQKLYQNKAQKEAQYQAEYISQIEAYANEHKAKSEDLSIRLDAALTTLQTVMGSH